MSNPSRPNTEQAPHARRKETGYRPRHARRPRTARPYLAMLPEAETLVLPVITDDTAPPASHGEQQRIVGPWLQRHEQTAPADDMAELRTLTRRLIADRPDLTHPVHTTAGVR